MATTDRKLTTEERGRVLQAVDAKVTFHGDGTTTARRFYAAPTRQTAGGFADEVRAALPGVEILSVEDCDDRRPGRAFFAVRFRIG
jgi:hypothetical protein